jgi:glutathione S-transferase
MHYAEGSAMAALILKITVDRLGEGGARIAPRLDSEMTTHLEYINSALEGREYLSATLSLQRTFR